jgi:Family of unknown function (DUF6134)
MRAVAAFLGGLLLMTNAQGQTRSEALRFAIMRNGAQIGSSSININRTGNETLVNIATDVDVKVLFITAYRFKETESERWTNDHLVTLNSTTDNNGTHHKLSAAQTPSALSVDVDGKTTMVDRNIVPSSFWNPQFLQHTTVLDTEDGVVSPMSVVDHGLDQLNIDGKAIKAHHYSIKSRYPEDVWYDERQNLVQLQLTGSDGSTITYKPI